MAEVTWEDFDYEVIEPPKKKSKTAQVARSAVGGTLGALGDVLGLGGSKELTPGQEARFLLESQTDINDPAFAALASDDEFPRYHYVPGSQDIEAFLGQPTAEEGGSPILQRAARGAALGAAIPGLGGGSLLQTLLGALHLGGAGAAGGAVEEATDSPLAGALTEIGGAAAPSLVKGLFKALSKNVPYTGREADLAKVAQDAGVTPEELTALMKKPGVQKALGRVAKKSQKAQELASAPKTKIGALYRDIKMSPAAAEPIEAEALGGLKKALHNEIKLAKPNVATSEQGAKAVKHLEDALDNLVVRGATGQELINWYQSLNDTINWKTVRQADAIKASIREPIKEALRKSSPKLGNDFELLNDLYSKSANLAKSLKPGAFDTLSNWGELGTTVKSVLTLDGRGLASVLGYKAVRKGALEALSNPRLAKIRPKLIKAINANDQGAALKILDSLTPKGQKPRKSWSDFDFELVEAD